MTEKPIKFAGKALTLTVRNDGDVAIANELFLDHQYQKCDDVIRKAKHTVIDVGGHLGFFSVMASTLNPKVPILSFEPHLGNFELLKTNLKKNRIQNVIPKQVAVSDVNGPVILQISQEDLNHSLLKAIEPTNQTEQVQSTTLERIFHKNRIEKCDLLKLDCEGSEYKIIQSTPQEIFERIDHIFLEYHDWFPGHNVNQLKQTLMNAGYRVEHYPNHKMKELGFLWCLRNNTRT
ncbi:FkbM family methyltransferase [Candidatus Peregrinibacteria bacterium]|nr:MAG: FkbM family methyltransferase [Candidatus Peregrinibacteria bacterium]